MSKNIKNLTYELSLISNSQDVGKVDILSDILISLGVDPNDIVQLFERGFDILSVYFTSLGKANKLKAKIQKLTLKNVKIVINSLEKKDWLTKWKEEFRPFRLTPKIKVVPAWLKDKYKNSKVDIVFIDTNLAFGTGMHPTTKYVSQFIERCSGKFESFFDVGTGTGILALVALKHGANEICVLDISEDCVRCAKENFELNASKPPEFVVCDIAKYKSRKKYDFVAANLITQDLIKDAKKILSFVKPGKYLAVSGISVHNYKLFKDVFKKMPLRCLKIEKEQGWVAALYRKR